MSPTVRWLARGMGEVPPCADWLSPAESARLAMLRFPKRRTEMRLGRWTAKHAVAAFLGLGDDPATLARIELRPAPTGAPLPFVADRPAPVSVSLTDRADWAVCVVAHPSRAVGCDLELVEPRTEVFIRDWFTPRERDTVLGAGRDRDLLANLVWSAKESALKVLQTGLRRDTRSVEIEILDPDGQARWARLAAHTEEGATFPGWWRRYHDFLLTVAADGEHGPPVCLEEPHLAAAIPAHSWLSAR
ncbi:MAG TPA: 4'-phosphopantetheinyl transferase superfamily protein [Actinophytocola sp.]|uniref:4'-phosphopantetheinyl transferase family protein n=1 Tax=Actinophytocola sp. TaxID=1872138 RepID=UPI002DB61E77|nr:4'-phosphopantetheinyl transferase superfamily protein [Actinophytocola sp.]HEU5470988.1 4'-phosphopantetheinyl transferase superfamily protein [Actinophytocola sp.]